MNSAYFNHFVPHSVTNTMTIGNQNELKIISSFFFPPLESKQDILLNQRRWRPQQKV